MYFSLSTFLMQYLPKNYKNVLLETWEELPPIFISSAETREGKEEILGYIEDINRTMK